MRSLNWLWRAALFLLLFAFALNNQHLVEVRWFLGYRWQAPMVFVVLIVFALGCVTGVLAMLPSWWRHRRGARQRDLLLPEPVAPADATTGESAAGLTASPTTAEAPAELPFPPDMPAPRKPAR
ncbi:DUF1049 domain-containing protein [Aquabacterium fontiphilum]|jgi:uncharacterized integral membrane protein|uniref:LapA family protein n=1 Tax=Aquabacterium fontiphilum TaxID=450365 RepID=UPI0013771CD5|nr:LapA family protein [Aquabacterium fontiphilum]NBD19599.1 DUF1049 domain-containing protein [Aquabacterium fontiphilum]